MRRARLLVLSACLTTGLGLASPAGATSLDFSAFGFNEILGAQVVLPEATLTATSGEVQRLFNANAFCFVLPAGCTGTGTVAFASPVQNLTLDIFGSGPGESTQIDVFGVAGLIDSLTVTADGVVDLSGAGTITSLTLASFGGASGTAFRDVTFDVVPEPGAALLLLAAGLAAWAGVPASPR